MKCFCKLPGKHHHELWYTLSGFHIVRLPLDSQLGLYILSWKQFWISYFLFSSDFPYASLHQFFCCCCCLLIILVWMHLLLLFNASFFFFLLFVHVCVLLILLWLATLCACPMRPPPLQSQQMHVYLSGLPPNTDPEGSKTPSPSEPEAKKDTKKESKKRKNPKTQANTEPKR